MRLIDADDLKKKAKMIDWLCNKQVVSVEDIDNASTVTPDKIQAIMSDYLIYRCEPERPQGKWICRTDTEWHFECNQCKGLSPWKAQFCGVCGADMRGDNNANND